MRRFALFGREAAFGPHPEHERTGRGRRHAGAERWQPGRGVQEPAAPVERRGSVAPFWT